MGNQPPPTNLGYSPFSVEYLEADYVMLETPKRHAPAGGKTDSRGDAEALGMEGGRDGT